MTEPKPIEMTPRKQPPPLIEMQPNARKQKIRDELAADNAAYRAALAELAARPIEEDPL